MFYQDIPCVRGRIEEIYIYQNKNGFWILFIWRALFVQQIDFVLFLFLLSKLIYLLERFLFRLCKHHTFISWEFHRILTISLLIKKIQWTLTHNHQTPICWHILGKFRLKLVSFVFSDLDFNTVPWKVHFPNLLYISLNRFQEVNRFLLIYFD